MKMIDENGGSGSYDKSQLSVASHRKWRFMLACFVLVYP